MAIIAADKPATRRHLSREVSAGAFAALMNVPTGLILALVLVYPVLYAGYLSVHRVGLGQLRSGVFPFIGLDNYARLFDDHLFWVALKNTALYALFALPLGLIIAFLLALLLSSNVKAVGFYRTFLFLPSLTPLVASAMVWLWIFNSQYGVLNHFLSIVTFGLVKHVAWLKDARFAMPSLVMMSFWSVGHTVVIMLAAMQEVPTSVYEAAEIDGAGFWQKVRSITLPMISPVLYFNTILGIIGVLQVFAVPFVMTGGGPARSTYFYSMYLYDNAFSYLRMGYACAMAWILFLVILGLTSLAVRAGRTRVHTTA